MNHFLSHDFPAFPVTDYLSKGKFNILTNIRVSPLGKVIRAGFGLLVCIKAMARSEVVLIAGTRPARALVARLQE